MPLAFTRESILRLFREDGEFQETGAEEEERKKITYDFASQEIS